MTISKRGRLLLTALLTSVLPPAALADTRPAETTLLRLARIARGEWRTRREISPGLPFARLIRATAQRHGLAPSLLAALVRAESNFDPYAVSHAGALGLGQLLPRTARELGVRDLFDPVENLDGAARYLSAQLERFGNVRLALSAYHAGPGRVSRGGRLPRTTTVYARRVMKLERDYRQQSIP